MLVLESDEETRAQSNVAICQITVQPGDRGRGRAPARLVWSGPRARPVVTQAQGPGACPPPSASTWEEPPLLRPGHLQASRRGPPPNAVPSLAGSA